jgi:hypothetical protein
MGPAAVVPILLTAWGGTAVAIGAKAVSAAITSSNHVPLLCDSVDRSDRVVEIRVRSCWLSTGFVGFLSGIGSAITGPLTGNSITHWWVEIETEKGWYIAQLNWDAVSLRKKSSLSAVNESGLSSGGNDSNGSITTKYTHKPSYRTMGEV